MGGIASSLFVGWICIGTQVAITKKDITFAMKTFSIEGCTNLTLDNSLSNYTIPVVKEIV